MEAEQNQAAERIQVAEKIRLAEAEKLKSEQQRAEQMAEERAVWEAYQWPPKLSHFWPVVVKRVV